MHLFNKTTQNSNNNSWSTSTSPTKELRTCLSLTTKTKRTKREQITKNMYNEINPCLSSYQTLLIFDICFYSLSQAHQEWYTDFIQYTIKRATLIHCLLNRNIVVYLFTKRDYSITVITRLNTVLRFSLNWIIVIYFSLEINKSLPNCTSVHYSLNWTTQYTIR